MSRVRVLREGTPTVDGRLLELSSTELPEKIPVLSKAEGGQIVGRVENLRRERDGWVTGVLVGLKLKRGYGLGATCTGLEVEGDKVVKRSTLQGVHVTNQTAWPGMTR